MKGNAYSDEFKDQVLKEVEETGNVTLVARNHGMEARDSSVSSHIFPGLLLSAAYINGYDILRY